jgi:hypothetical protein
MPTRGLQRNGRLKCGHSLDQLQPCAYRPLGIVLVRLWVAEVHQHAVTHVLRYEAPEALHSLGDALLVGGDNLTEVLRVHSRR